MTDGPVRPPRRVHRPALPEQKGLPEQEQASEEQAPEQKPEGRTIKATEIPEGFIAREGDTLMVSIPEVTLPLPQKYATIKLGGFIYTRRLHEGDDVRAEGETTYRWLEKFSEAVGRDRFRRWAAEFKRDRD
jgi:hypothetical protein